MTLRLTTAAAIAVMAMSLTGCASSGAADPPTVIDDAASALPTDLGDATSGDEDLDGEADAGAALTSEQFCGFLAEETPEVVDLAPPEYAAATFGSALFGFYTDNGLLTDIDGADMDALAAEGCPEAAAELLPVLGADSFATLFSS